MSFTGFSDQIDSATVVGNTSFYPEINLSAFQASYRLPGEYREDMLIDRLKLAITWANRELADWQAATAAEGIMNIREIPQDDMPAWGSPLVLLYIRAVSCKAKAFLLADYATMLRKSDAQSDAMEADETASRWHRMASDAINQIQGKTNIHAEAL
nr:head completion/stabilization protein [uncultured Desulfobacter sp.]